MSDIDLRTRIAAIVADHQLQYVDCYCGERFQAAQPWGDHVADAVIRELKKDYMLVPNPDETYQTPRTEWIAEDGSTWVT